MRFWWRPATFAFFVVPLIGQLELIGGLLAQPATRASSDYPSREITLYSLPTPTVPGHIAKDLTIRLGQPVNLFSLSSRTFVTKSVIEARPDGYTLLVGGVEDIIFPSALYRSAPFDPLAELTPVAMLYKTSYGLVANKALPYSTFQEVIAAAKSEGKLRFSIWKTGSYQHIVAEALQAFTGTWFPYTKDSCCLNDVFHGDSDLGVDTVELVKFDIDHNRAKPLAILSANRNPLLPNVPTSVESGISHPEIGFWVGLFAPANTPRANITRLQEAIAAGKDVWKPQYEKYGDEPMPIAAENLKEYMSSQYEMWKKVIKGAGIQLD